MNARALVLAEDSPEDRELILAALQRITPAERVTLCSVSLQELDYLFARDACGFRNPPTSPARHRIAARTPLARSEHPPSNHPT